jgi:putative membrane protein
MGGADVVPGVSGGTVAFITGIYEELIQSIKSIDMNAIKLLLRFRIAEFWKQINGNFLITLVTGILISLLSLSKLMLYLLEHHPISIWSFFFGLILISTPLILRDIKKWNAGTVLSFIAGVVIAYWITIVSPAETPSNLFFIFCCGAIAICAMILPGISGAFILLLLGKYEYMITALTEFNIPVIMVFVAGCVLGLLGFSHFLNWILKNYRYATLAVLAGFMLGSLNKVWPWKQVVSFRLNSAGEQVPAFDKSIAPWDYLANTGQDPQILKAILFVMLGIILVIGIEKTAAYLKSKP